MTTKRSYEDGCAAAHGLDLIGERWALLVVRELVLGPKRFTDLRAGLPGISPNVLTERLEELERASVLRRRRLPLPAASWVYELTEWGRELESVIMALGRWAARSPVLPMGNPIGTDAFILSLRTMFDAHAAAGFKANIELRLGDEHFLAQIAAGRMTLSRAGTATTDAVIETDSNTLAAMIYGGMSLTEALRSGKLRTDGDRNVVKRFATLFPMPARAPVVFSAPARAVKARATGSGRSRS
jgi:DNA-binding HxlR family transcriptional regulator/putative sterol carrier protein